MPARELEAMAVAAIRRHLQGNDTDPKPISQSDRELIEQHLLRATLSAKEVRLQLRADGSGNPAVGQDNSIVFGAIAASETTIVFPWTVPAATAAKGIVHVPAHNTPMKPGSRETLLIAIAKARRWIKEVERGQSFADIARREGKAERHVRHLARLAFVSPRIITAVIDGTAPAGLTVASLTRSLSYCWAKQERKISIRHGQSSTPIHS